MMSACRTWALGGFVLTTQDKLDLAKPRLLEDRRTTDEIAILYSNAVLYGLYTGIMVDTWTKPASASGAILPPLVLAGASAGIALSPGVRPSGMPGLDPDPHARMPAATTNRKKKGFKRLHAMVRPPCRPTCQKTPNVHFKWEFWGWTRQKRMWAVLCTRTF
jgi:hypothetical protein